MKIGSRRIVLEGFMMGAVVGLRDATQVVRGCAADSRSPSHGVVGHCGRESALEPTPREPVVVEQVTDVRPQTASCSGLPQSS